VKSSRLDLGSTPSWCSPSLKSCTLNWCSLAKVVPGTAASRHLREGAAVKATQHRQLWGHKEKRCLGPGQPGKSSQNHVQPASQSVNSSTSSPVDEADLAQQRSCSSARMFARTAVLLVKTHLLLTASTVSYSWRWCGVYRPLTGHVRVTSEAYPWNSQPASISTTWPSATCNHPTHPAPSVHHQGPTTHPAQPERQLWW
jgi:hypothetical protein